MKAILRLIRLPNLLIIVLTQYLIRHMVIEKLLQPSNPDAVKFSLQLSHLDFFLLSFSCMLIAAAGYVINDYFDTRTDLINHPDTVVIDRGVKRRVAMATHIILTLIAVVIGFYVARKALMLKLGFIHIFSAVALWFYSTDFKKRPLVGNIVVSLLTAMVPFMVVLFEYPALNQKYFSILQAAGANFSFLLLWTGAFAFFAFMVSLIREVIKDMEDEPGDRQTGCRTIPIAWGMKAAKSFVILLIITTIMMLGFILSKHGADDKISFYYILLGLMFPLLVLIYHVFKSDTPKQFHQSSLFVKLIMLIGVCYSFVIYFTH